jgi:hypothetical protein
MTPAAHIACVCTLLLIFGAFAIGNIIERPRNDRGTRLRRWLKFHGTLK